MMVALASVPIDKVEDYFLQLKDEISVNFLPVYEYFNNTYA